MPPACRPILSVTIVDDDDALLSSLKFMLEIEGFTVCAYGSGEELLDKLDTTELSCVVIDYHLNGLNGLELMQRLRRRGVAAPAILMTTQPSAQLRRQAASASMTVIEKPLLGDILLERIRAFG